MNAQEGIRNMMGIKSKPLTQEEKVIKMLVKAGKRGVANYEFPSVRILKYTSVISELRKDGHNIYCERQFLPNGRATNVFKYYLGE